MLSLDHKYSLFLLIGLFGCSTGSVPIDTGTDLAQDSASGSDATTPPDGGRPNRLEVVPTLEWSHELPEMERFGSSVMVADLDADGRVELITIRERLGEDRNAWLDVWDPAARERLWTSEERAADAPLHAFTIMAIGDLDDDDLGEIVAVTANNDGIVVFEHDGTVKWTAPFTANPERGATAPVIADLERDGDAEIVVHDAVYDHLGNRLWSMDGLGGCNLFGLSDTGFRGTGCISIVADLERDGDLEIIVGATAYQHDGTVAWDLSERYPNAYAAIANFDEDDDPEIILAVQRTRQVVMISHDGSVVWEVVHPAGGTSHLTYVDGLGSPTIGDITGDDIPEIAIAGENLFAVFKSDGDVVWTAPAVEVVARTGSTMFDFNADGVFEVVYRDTRELRVWDGFGNVIATFGAGAPTGVESPIVADVDSDGEAEIVVTSGTGLFVYGGSPGWADARALWNQHDYFIQNVTDDLGLPADPTVPFPWLDHNTYRVQLSPALIGPF